MAAEMVAELACECVGPIVTMEAGIEAAKAVCATQRSSI
jgi:hypothetical protein